MERSVLISTFFLTLLLGIGLFFFIRASVKDRTQVVKLQSTQAEDILLSNLRDYFDQRAYQVKAIEPTTNCVTLEGTVRPSLFLALFLSGLSAVGALCLGLVFSMLLPQGYLLGISLLALAPLTGLFYWRKAARTETVSFRLESASDAGPNVNDSSMTGSMVTVSAHRDELESLKQSLHLKILDYLAVE
jgi:ABC-type polysaccharide/polyol phosphate export permease